MASTNNKRVVVANGATHDCTGLITTAPGAQLVQHLLIACFGDGLCGYRALAKLLGVPVSEVLGWFIKAGASRQEFDFLHTKKYLDRKRH